MMDYNEMKKLSQEALNDPKPGDYWQEMYSWQWHMYVLEVEETDKGKIITTMSASAPCTFPEDGRLQKRTHAEFKTWLSYGSIEGTWAHCSKRNANIDWWKPQPPLTPAPVEFTYPHPPVGGYGCKTPGQMEGKYYSASDYNRLSDELKTLKEKYTNLEKENEASKERVQNILNDVAGILINHTELNKEKELENGI